MCIIRAQGMQNKNTSRKIDNHETQSKKQGRKNNRFHSTTFKYNFQHRITERYWVIYQIF